MDAALSAADGFVKYESMPGPPEVVQEGREPSDLLALLSAISSDEEDSQDLVEECSIFSKDYQVHAC